MNTALARSPSIAPVGLSGFSLEKVRFPVRGLSLPVQFQQRLRNLGFEIVGRRRVSGHGVDTERYQLQFQGIDVLGAHALVHSGPAGEAKLSFRSVPKFTMTSVPEISREEASRIALGIIGNRDLEISPQLKILPSEKDENAAQLIYWITIAPTETLPGRDILINAQKGTLIADLSHDREIADTMTMLATERCQKAPWGSPEVFEPRKCAVAIKSGSAFANADESAIRAERNQQTVLDYYWSTHGRDSFDNKGSMLVSVVHVGKSYPNAFWNSHYKVMAYGDGDGEFQTDMTKSLDVAGHEMTHGVISSTSRLLGQGESGALDEAISDFFGILIAARAKNSAPDWGLGKETFLSEQKLVGLRNLQKPSLVKARSRDDDGNLCMKPHPSHMKEAFVSMGSCDKSNDFCHIHVNALIPGHAMYQIARAIGVEAAEKLIYVTATQYLTETSNFKNFSLQTQEACRQLLQDEQCDKVREAFKIVGL